MAATKRSTNLFTEADGRQHAVDMLRELGERWGQDDDLDPDDVGKNTDTLINREPDIMRRYLATVRGKNSPKLERGFLCLLSEFIGSSVNGCPLDLENYEEKHLGARHG